MSMRALLFISESLGVGRLVTIEQEGATEEAGERVK